MHRAIHATMAVGAATVVAIAVAPAAHADNTRLNNGVVANVYTVQHQAGCTTDIKKKNPALTQAAEWHANDVLNNRALDGDLGSDGSTPPQTRAAAAGFTALSPRPSPSTPPHWPSTTSTSSTSGTTTPPPRSRSCPTAPTPPSVSGQSTASTAPSSSPYMANPPDLNQGRIRNPPHCASKGCTRVKYVV